MGSLVRWLSLFCAIWAGVILSCLDAIYFAISASVIALLTLGHRNAPDRRLDQTGETLRILGCQIAVPRTDDVAARDAHLVTSTDKVRRELQDGSVDLVVLPELSSIDYSRDAFCKLNELAEPLDGPSFQAWKKIAIDFNTHVLFSFPRRAAGANFISAAVVGPDGKLVGYYDKLHLCQYGASMEKEYFSRGEHLLVFNVAGFRIAPIICYDIRIPELSRKISVDLGVDVICHVGAYARDSSFNSWHPFAKTRAVENLVHLLSLNRAGEAFGGSIYCRPWMDETLTPKLFAEHDEDFKRLTLTRSEIDAARETYSFLKDRRDSYDFDVQGNCITARLKRNYATIGIL